MKVTIILIIICTFGTVTKGLLEGLEELKIGARVETVQTTRLLITTRILRRVLEIWVGLQYSNLFERSSAKADMKNVQGVTNNNEKGKSEKEQNKDN